MNNISLTYSEPQAMNSNINETVSQAPGVGYILNAETRARNLGKLKFII